MKVKDVLTNDFTARYVPQEQAFLIYPGGDETISPIRLRLQALKDMGPEAAASWVGKTFLLLVPELRREVLEISDTGA